MLGLLCRIGGRRKVVEVDVVVHCTVYQNCSMMHAAIYRGIPDGNASCGHVSHTGSDSSRHTVRSHRVLTCSTSLVASV